VDGAPASMIGTDIESGSILVQSTEISGFDTGIEINARVHVMWCSVSLIAGFDELPGFTRYVLRPPYLTECEVANLQGQFARSMFRRIQGEPFSQRRCLLLTAVPPAHPVELSAASVGLFNHESYGALAGSSRDTS